MPLVPRAARSGDKLQALWVNMPMFKKRHNECAISQWKYTKK